MGGDWLWPSGLPSASLVLKANRDKILDPVSSRQGARHRQGDHQFNLCVDRCGERVLILWPRATFATVSAHQKNFHFVFKIIKKYLTITVKRRFNPGAKLWTTSPPPPRPAV